MVVCHDDGQPVLFPVGNLICRRNSVVTGNNRINFLVQRPINKHFIQAIPVSDTVRNICIHIRSQSGQTFLKNISGIYAVDIIISYHTYSFFFPDFLGQNIHSTIHILHKHAVIKICNRPIEIKVNLLIPDNISVPDQTGRNR